MKLLPKTSDSKGQNDLELCMSEDPVVLSPHSCDVSNTGRIIQQYNDERHYPYMSFVAVMFFLLKYFL
jgi:hypothetical protein